MAIATGTALLAAGALGAGASAYSANKAAQAQKEAAKASQVDINALDAQTREIARRNALESMALEKELTPEVAALRQQSIQGLLGGMGTTQREQNIADLLYGGLGTQIGQAPTRSDIGSPLLRAAISRAQADLARGGKLDEDVQDAVTRAALAKAGRVSGGGLGLGRDITARDLGLTSMDVAQQRLQRASQLGAQELGMSQARAQMGLAEQEAGNQLALANASNLLNKLQLLQQIQTAGYGRTLSAAGLGQSIAPPVVGLDPGAIASAVTGNAANLSAAKSNLANIYGAQSQGLMQLGGQLAGAGILAGMGGPAASTGTGVPSYLAKTGAPYGGPASLGSFRSVMGR